MPTDDPDLMSTFVRKYFSPNPQLLGGNHTTLAFKRLVASHTRKTSEGEIFSRPAWSKITPDVLEKFKYRYVHFVISPLPLSSSLSSVRIKHGLLCLSRQLNDNAKQVKTATLNDQLVKARKVLEDFLRNAIDPVTKKPVFGKDQNIWPQSHKDLENPIYSQSGIQSEVKSVLSVEYRSSVSAIKVLCTCPEDVYQLLLSITSVCATNKDGDTRPIVNSTKSLGLFTIQFCRKEKLISTLSSILSNLSDIKSKSENKSSSLRPVPITKFAQEHQQSVKYHQMLNAIVTDLTTGKLDSAKQNFKRAIGEPGSEGFYEEESFEKVIMFSKIN